MLAMGTSEVAFNRTDADLLLEGGTVYVLTASYATDGQGGQISTFGTSGTVAGVLRPLSGAEMAAGGGVLGVQQYELRVPFDTVLHLRDRVKTYGRTFEVDYVHPTTPWMLLQYTRVTEVK